MSRLLISAMNCSPEPTGCGKCTGELAAAMARRGHSVEVVTAAPHYPGWVIRPPYLNRYSVDRCGAVKIWRVPLMLRSPMSGIWRLVAPLSFAIASAPLTIWRAIAKKPETILSVEPTLFSAPAVALAARLTGARSVLHVQDLEVDAAFAVGHLAPFGILKRVGARIELFCFRRFDAIVTISAQMAELIVQKGVPQHQVHLIRNWVDLKSVYPRPVSAEYRKALCLPPDSFIVLYSGNIGPKQGLHVVVEAAKILAERNHIHFVIAGEGPSKAELVELSSELANLDFLPLQPYERLSEFLSLCDLHVLPQDERTCDLVLPSKLGGMLASGRPIVVTAGADTELGRFVGTAATIVPPGDAKQLADAISSYADGQISVDRDAQIELAELLSEPIAMSSFEEILFPNLSMPGDGIPERRMREREPSC